jgi:hypothetical protein
VVAECSLRAKLQDQERPGMFPTIDAHYLESLVLGVTNHIMQRKCILMWILCGEQQKRSRSMLLSQIRLYNQRYIGPPKAFPKVHGIMQFNYEAHKFIFEVKFSFLKPFVKYNFDIFFLNLSETSPN